MAIIISPYGSSISELQLKRMYGCLGEEEYNIKKAEELEPRDPAQTICFV